ncbi:PLxRFG domain-containing protein [Photobacterium swingsii]|nr:PLxRFG domain-containing protein [Photobacterium swingsii]
MDISPAAVVQVAEMRKSGQINQEQAISALQRIINSVELNQRDQLAPTEQENSLRNQQALERNSQEQAYERGQGGAYQPNVEESEAFRRNQARLQQGFQERSQTNAASGNQQSPGERDITPQQSRVTDQTVRNAPQVEFDRWSDFNAGDENVDQRYDRMANEYEMNPEDEEDTFFRREPHIVAQEPAQAPPEPEQRRPRHNARQAKKAEQRNEQARQELEQSRLDQEEAERQANAPVYQAGEVTNTPFAIALAKRAKIPNANTSTSGHAVNQSTQMGINSRALVMAVGDEVGDVGVLPENSFETVFNGLSNDAQREIFNMVYPDIEYTGQSLNDNFDTIEINRAWEWRREEAQKRENARIRAETATQREAAEAKIEEEKAIAAAAKKARLAEERRAKRAIKVGDNIPNVVVNRLSTYQVNITPVNDAEKLRGKPIRVERNTANKTITATELGSNTLIRATYGTRDPEGVRGVDRASAVVGDFGTLSDAIDWINEAVSYRSEIQLEALRRYEADKASNNTEQRQEFNRSWDNVLTKSDRRQALKIAYPDFETHNISARASLSGDALSVEAYNKLESIIYNWGKETAPEPETDTNGDIQISHGGLGVTFKAFDNELNNGYNRSTHLGKGRDFNQELQDGAKDIINQLSSRNLLDTPERKVKAKEMIQNWISRQSDFLAWEARHAEKNPSWLVTGRAGRNNDRHNSANERHMRDFSNKVDAVSNYRKSIVGAVESIRNEEQRAAHQASGEETAKKNLESDVIGYIVRDVYNYIKDGKGVVAADNKKWALPKAKKALDNLISLDPSRADELIKKIDNSIQTDSQGKFTLKNVLGGRRSAVGKLVDDRVSGSVREEAQQEAPATETPANNAITPVMRNAVIRKLAKIKTAEDKANTQSEKRYKTESLLSTERSSADSNNPKMRAANQSYKRAQEALKKAESELDDLFKRYRDEQGGTESAWDDLVNGQQGHLDVNSWSDLNSDNPPAESNTANEESNTTQGTPTVNEAAKAIDSVRELIAETSSYKVGQRDRAIIALNKLLKTAGIETHDEYVIGTKLRSSYESERIEGLRLAAEFLGVSYEPEPTPPTGGGNNPSGNTRESSTRTQTSTRGRGRSRPSSINGYIAEIRKANDGDLERSEVLELIDQWSEDSGKLLDDMASMTIPNIFKVMGGGFAARYKGERKDTVVKSAINRIGSDFNFVTTADEMTTIRSLPSVRLDVESMSDEEFNAIRDKKKAAAAEAQAETERRKSALGNPQTLDDYQRYAQANGGGIQAFSDEQLATFDRLYVENQLEKQAARHERQLEQQATVTAVETNGDLSLSKIDSFNDKKGVNRFGAAFGDVDSDQYALMKDKARQLGGWYARKWQQLPARFDFKTEQARDDFLSVMGGLNVDQSERVQARAEVKAETLQEHQFNTLTKKADSLQIKADELLNGDRQTNTARRAAMAASAVAKGDRFEAQANIMRKIASGVKSGDFKILGNLTDITQLDELTGVMNRVKWDMPEEVREKYASRDNNGNWSLLPETKFNDIARYVKYPAARSRPESLRYIADEIRDKPGFKAIAKKIDSNLKNVGNNEMINLNGSQWDGVVKKVREIARNPAKFGIYRAEHINEMFKTQDRLKRMGINGAISLREALREYEQANNGKISTKREVTRLETLTNKITDIIRGNRNAFNDFFPTPENEAQDVVQRADIKPGMKVLEPNAGMGHLADLIAEKGADLDVGELANTMAELLEEKGHNVVAGDFLEYNPGEIYDRIVMNPPFSNDSDITHINHALTMLKPGGKLVAITSSMAGDRGNTTNKNFRRYLDEVGAVEELHEPGAFNQSLNKTGVRTKVIEIDKPDSDVNFDNIRFSKTSEVESKPRASMTPDSVATVAQAWLDDYEGLKSANVTVVPTMNDLYDLVETEENANVKGAWLSGDNRVVLVAENLENIADVRRTLRHELIAHNGLYGNLTTEQQKALTRKVNSLRGNSSLNDIFTSVDRAYRTAPADVKAEEVIARIAENESGSLRKLADKVISWVMGALRKSGVLNQERVTLSEIRNMINNTDSDLRKANGKTTLSNIVRFSKKISDMSEDEAQQSDPAMSVADALSAQNDSYFKQMLGKTSNGWIAKTFDSIKNGGWSLLNLRQIAEVGRNRVGQDVGNILDGYVENKDLFTTRKTDLIEKVSKQAEALNQFRRDNPEESEQVFNFLHDATLADIDPSEEYRDQTAEKTEMVKSLIRLYSEYGGENSKRAKEVRKEREKLEKEIKGEKRRKIKHQALRDKFLAMSPEQKKIFQDVRDHYISQREEMDKALEDRIADLAMAGSAKSGENTYHRYMMEKSRLGFYVPLGRFGEYWLSVMEDGESRFQMYETETDMMQDYNKLVAAGYQPNMGKKLADAHSMQNVSTGFVSDVLKSITSSNTNDQAKDALRDDIYQLYLQTMPDRSIRRAFIHRKGIAGFSEDAARVLADQGVRQANQQARLETEKRFTDLMDTLKKETESSNNVSAGRLYNEMGLRHQWMLNPQRAKWAQSLTGFGFFWQIGVSPASALINLSQNWQVALPVIGSKHGFKDTAAEMASLSTLFAKTFAAKKREVGFNGEIDVSNGILGSVVSDDERKALKHAIQIGAIDVTQMADLSGMAESDSTSYTGRMAKVQQWIGKPFHWAEVLNREVAFLTAYRMAKKNGSNNDDAVRYAAKATWESHFDYSSRNRARFMQGDVAAVALQFRQYSQNMTYFLVSNFFKAIKGNDPETKKLARRQLLSTMGVTFAIGGLNAMPIATLAGIANLAYAAAGDDNEPWDAETELKNAMAETFGEDLGKHIYYGTMPSVSSRINIDFLRMWVQENNADNPYDWVLNMGQQSMGVTFGTALSFGRGLGYLVNGQTLRAAEYTSPKWIKDVLRTARYARDGGNVTNRNGEILVDDISPLEYVSQGLGFTPSRLVMQYDINSALKGYEREAMNRRKSLMNAYWLAYRNRDHDGVKSIQAKLREYNKSSWGRVRPITSDVLKKSVKQHQKLSSKAVNGAHFNDSYIKLLNENQYW